MQVICPNCGAKVTADHINIQRMTAVCSACDTVFSIDLPEADVKLDAKAAAKAKRRKVKQPSKLIVRDADTLQMEFRTNFKLDQNAAVIINLVGGSTMAGVALMVTEKMGFLHFLPLAFFAVALAFFYGLALTVVNKTHIEMDEDKIRVTRKPLPNPLKQEYEVSLAGVEAIKYEETAISKKEAYDLPRYRVWAETVDGTRRTVVDDVTEEYAVYIAQHLEERLQADLNADPDISRLEDRGHRMDDEIDVGELVRRSSNNVRMNSHDSE